MKNYVLFLFTALFLFGCAHIRTIEYDAAGNKILRGTIHRNMIEADSSFPWFKENYRTYQPDTSVMSILKESKENIHCLLFFGTWCSDSKLEVPRMFKVFDELGISNADVTLIGIDHEKKSVDNLPKKYKINRIPTLIVFRGEKEIGRIIESPIQSIEIDLLAILHK
ncbi:MAG: thioredoxin family protein [Bacteroidetes bacterium]|nr:thioredoxin family protein [Bacteroidota bacterium]